MGIFDRIHRQVEHFFDEEIGQGDGSHPQEKAAGVARWSALRTSDGTLRLTVIWQGAQLEMHWSREWVADHRRPGEGFQDFARAVVCSASKRTQHALRTMGRRKDPA